MKKLGSALFVAFLFLAMDSIDTLSAQAPAAIYDEAKVPPYTLPDPLVLANGQKVTDADTWLRERRPEILKLFETHVYGRTPARPANLKFAVRSVDSQALGGKAIRKEVTISFSDRPDEPKMDLLLYIPREAKKPVPAFLGLNFNGNHSIHKDPGITLGYVWNRPSKGQKAERKLAEDSTRGQEASRWEVEKILARGYALGTIYYGDIIPDFAEGLEHGVHRLYAKDGKVERAPDDWGAIGGWAWGLSRALDYLATDGEIDARRVAVMGHSRLGKTALWAGAQDQRFAIVISNNSGCGGAALSKRCFGETVGRINTSFPHWFCLNFRKFNEKEQELPLDQHMLIALIAPRPVYVASAEEDLWADPRGEFLAAKHAEPVYRLLGRDGLGVSDMPKLNQPVMGTIGYHIRSGKHDVTDYDWEQYLTFADKHLK